MTFIITFIALVIERFFHWNQLRQWRWLTYYQRQLSHSRLANWPAFLLLMITILPLILIVALINYFLNGWFYGILKLIFGVIVLLYCLGPHNLWMQVYQCINHFNKEDPNQAVATADKAFHIGQPENADAFHRALIRAIFVAANKRIFAVIFWFILLGPAGAVLYRSVALLSTQSSLGLTAFANKLLHLLDWIPIRLLTFIFALMGHFTRVFIQWKQYVFKGLEFNETLLVDAGMASLDFSEDASVEKDAIRLLDRVFVAGLVLLAILAMI